MKLKEIDISSRDWRKIQPQLNEYSYYIIKERHHSGSIVLHCSRISKAVWAKHQNVDKPHAWEYSLGTHSRSFEKTGSSYYLDEEILEIYEINDPEIMRERAKRELKT